MSLSNDLISQFVKVTKDKNNADNGTTVYGTVVKVGDETYVKIDGSDQLTPVSTTTNVEADEKVSVLIKDHTAMVTGNVSSPAARTAEVEEIGTKITEVEILIADKVSTKQLEAQVARIDTLTSDNVTINKKLSAAEAEIAEINAEVANIDEIYAKKAEVDAVVATTVEAEIAKLDIVEAEDLDAINADINNLETTYATVTGELEAQKAAIDSLEAGQITVEQLEGKFANIDFANIDEAAIENFFSKSGMIENLVVGDGTIAGELVGVTIKGDLIEGSTVKADKLVIKGSDGIYYKLNFEAGTFQNGEAVPTDSLHGSVITAKSITAEKVSVKDLVAFGATIGGFHINNTALYSGTKSSIDNTTQGVYLDSTGQMNIGDSSNFIKYYRAADGTYKLAISAESVRFSAGKSVEEVIDEKVNSIEIGGRNLIIKKDLVGGYINPDDPSVIVPSGDGKRGDLTTGWIDVSSCNEVVISLYDVRTWGGIGRYGLYDADKNPIRWAAYNPYEPSSVVVNVSDASYMRATLVDCIALRYKIEKGNKPTDWTPAPEDDSLDNLQLGGRNLILDSDFSACTDWHGNEAFRVFDPSNRMCTVKFTESEGHWFSLNTSDYAKSSILGKEVVLSVEYLVTEPIVGGIIEWQVFVERDTAAGYSHGYLGFTHRDTAPIYGTETSEKWMKAYATGVIGTDPFVNVRVVLQTAQASGEIKFRNLKLEFGNRPSDWTPAPEDTDSEISKVSQTASDAVNKAQSVQNNLDNLEIGSRNLIVNSSLYRKETPLTNTSSSWDGVIEESKMYMPCEAGKKYILQCCTDGLWGNHAPDGSGTGWTHIYLIYCDDNGAVMGYQPIENNPSDGLTGRQTWTFNAWFSGSIKFRFDIHTNGTPYTANWWDLKCECGDKATDWTPAPEDVDANIDSSAQASNEHANQAAKDAVDTAQKNTNAALENYVPNSDFNNYKTETDGKIDDANDKIDSGLDAANAATNAVGDRVNAIEGDLKMHFEMTDDGLVIFAGNNPDNATSYLRLKLSATEIGFYKQGATDPFGKWDGDYFHTGNMVVKTNERAQFGAFAFVPRSNGSLSFLQVGEFNG